MKSRVVLFAVVGLVSLPVLATSGFTPSSGESSGSFHAMPGAKTRAQVQQETAQWQRNPVTADGWREVGGDAGWVYAGPARSAKTRQQVMDELAQWQRNPVTADGWKEVGGDAGWRYVGNAREDRPMAATPSADGPAAMAPQRPAARGSLSRSGHR